MKAQNKKGTWFKLVQISTNGYLVYKLCSNYSGQVHGGESKTWRYCLPCARMPYQDMAKMAREGMSKVDALVLFNKKVKGKQN